MVSPNPFADNVDQRVDFNIKEPDYPKFTAKDAQKERMSLVSQNSDVKESEKVSEHNTQYRVRPDSAAPSDHIDSYKNLPVLSNPDEKPIPRISEKQDEEYVSVCNPIVNTFQITVMNPSIKRIRKSTKNTRNTKSIRRKRRKRGKFLIRKWFLTFL